MILESYSNKVGTAELIGIHILFFINACCLFLKSLFFCLPLENNLLSNYCIVDCSFTQQSANIYVGGAGSSGSTAEEEYF